MVLNIDDVVEPTADAVETTAKIGTPDWEQRLIVALAKKDADCTPGERKMKLIERVRVKQSFPRFLKYCKIVQAPTIDNPGGVIPFELWPHILDVVKLLLTKTLLVWLKSRQVGASWLVAAYVLWYALTKQGAMIILFSKGELEAAELLAKCKRIYKHLPDFMQLEIKPDSTMELGFPTMMSTIKALPATESAGISFTASIVVCDEWIEHPFADENYMSSKPTRDAGGQFIGIFTSNHEKLNSLAPSIMRDAVAGVNDFIPIFTPWYARPGRDKAWYEVTERNIPARELGTLTPKTYMSRNYPASIEEALSPSQTIAAFDLKKLDQMMSDTKNPIKIIRDGIDLNIVHIFQDYAVGQYYIAATDTSHGVGKDFSVTCIMNVRTGAVVADIFNNTVPPEELALHSIRMLDLFKSPLWFIEANDWGGVTISTAQALNYKNFGYQDDKRKKIGFLTTGHKMGGTRTDLFGELIPAINNGQITVYNADGLKQFYDIIRNAEKGGRIEAMSGRNDDYPMAVGICWLKKDEVKTGADGYKPIHTLTFASPALRRR